jgi:hypothetical protein
MKALTTPSGNFGPFHSVETLSDRYRCDNTDLPFTVVGQGSIVDADTITWPEPPAPVKTREELKAARAIAVEAIKVTTQAGNTFDGDEVSQGRMARAIIALSTGLAPSVSWVLADNSVIEATPQELTEALVLAGQAQAAIWVI